MAEWLRCLNNNLEDPGASPATIWSCFSVALSSTPRPRLIASWSASCQLGLLTMLQCTLYMYVEFEIFVSSFLPLSLKSPFHGEDNVLLLFYYLE